VLGAGCWVLAQNPFVLVGEDLYEFRQHGEPVFQDPFGAGAAGEFEVALDQSTEDRLVFGDRVQVYGGGVAALFGEVAGIVENVGKPAAHAGGEVAATAAQYHDQAFGHVFAAMIAEAFDDGGGAGVAHGKAFARHAVKVRFAAGGAVEGYVADQDIFFGQESGIARRIDDQAAAG